MTDAWRWAQRNPSAVLLYVQLGGLLLYPFLEGPSDKLGTLVLSLFGLVVLGLAVAAVRATPSLTWVAVLIGVPAVALTFVDVFSNNSQPWHLISDCFHAAFYAYTLVALLRYMFADDKVTTDEWYAIGATFTIGIWLFAYVSRSARRWCPARSRRPTSPKPSAAGSSCCFSRARR